MARRNDPPQVARLVIVPERLADKHLTDTARRLYIRLFASETLSATLSAPSQWLSISTRFWAAELEVSMETLRSALAQLCAAGFIERERRPGARVQFVRRVSFRERSDRVYRSR